MLASAVVPAVRATRGRRTVRRTDAERARPRTDRAEVGATRPHALDLEAIASQWQLALDAAQRALGAAGTALPTAELVARRQALALEREHTSKLLAVVADDTGVRPVPWLYPVPVTRRMLGLPPTVAACLFDLDGVLTDSDEVHVWAWGVVFDEFLLRVSAQTGWHFIPFDRDADYAAYIEGRSRLDGIHAFLDSRGIRLPEGTRADPAEADTAWGLAKRKGEATARRLGQRGVTALEGARRYLETAARAGLKRSVISASASTQSMLARAQLATVVEDHIDADVIRRERLRSPPAPDLPLAACRRLGVRPEEAVLFTHSPAGVAAGHAAGVAVVGVEAHARFIPQLAAGRVVPSLRSLLEGPLVAGSER